ncbi:MAG: carboxypeptidase-like regulatory domain-containing protein [Ekhidna sp.]|nr:carboxypeptidase-like regulatory domain-containing protein [Ekhidna sp.]
MIKFIKNISLSLYSIIVYSSVCYGQDKEVLSGIVRDALDRTPISNAHIYTSSGESTATDSLGIFKLFYTSQDSAYTVISHIGYKNDTIFSSQVKFPQTIEVNLATLATRLNEVVIHTVYDPALILMRKVIEGIPKNYHRDSCSSHYVLLRESLQLKGNDSTPLYLIETIIKDHASFESKNLNYQIDLLNARTFINSDYYNFSEIGLTGTAFIYKKYDPVLTLSGPLDISNYERKYKFSITDTLYVSNKTFIKLNFKRNNDTAPHGYLIVNIKDFSISEFYISRSKEHSFLPSIDSYKRKSIGLFVTYNWAKDHYVINELNVAQEYFPFKGDTLVSQGYYLNLKDRPCEKDRLINISLNEDDVLLDELDKKKVPKWKPVSIAETKKFDYLFEQETIPKGQKAGTNRKKSFKSRLRLGYRVPLWIRNISDFNIDFKHPNVSFNGSPSADKSFDVSIGATITYKTHNNLLSRIGAFDSFNRNRFSNRYVEVLYEKEINDNATSFLNTGIQFNYLKQRIFLASITGANLFSVRKREFDSGEFEIYFEQRSLSISPVVSYSQKVGRSSYLEFGGSLPINTFIKNGIFFIEKDSFFKRKQAFTNENLIIMSRERVLINNTLSLFFDITWRLK